MQLHNVVFLCAGLTGGPLTPLLGISNALDNTKPYIIGLKKGFEGKVSVSNNIPLLQIPEAKLSILSFSNVTFFDGISGILHAFFSIFQLCVAFYFGVYYILTYKPVMILSAGGFTTVPLFFAGFLLKKLRLTHTQLVYHQQDPLMSITGRLCIPLSDVTTSVFEHKNYSFDAIIPNPIDTNRFDMATLDTANISIPLLASFVRTPSQKPLLLIFGGGSGARIINNWVTDNKDIILERFRIIHLTGEAEQKPYIEDDYFCTSSLLVDMPVILNVSDVVICRAGLASITELSYLQKPGFLVPIQHSHQEYNASAVSHLYKILTEDETENWVETLFTSYPQYFHNIKRADKATITNSLNHYYTMLNERILNSHK